MNKVPDPRNDPAAEAAARPKRHDPADDKHREQSEAALENVSKGYEKAPPGAGGEPSWPTGGNISRGPKRSAS